MARKGLLSQFVNSWVRQMGRESAHTAYGDITGKNTRESFSDVQRLKSFPSVKNYLRLILAQLVLPVIGPIWALVKGCIRLFGKKIKYYGEVEKSIYKLDRRYSDNQRYVGKQTVNIVLERLKNDSPKKDVKRYNTHAIIYIIVGLLGIVSQGCAMYALHKDEAKELASLPSYTKWHTVSVSDDFTGVTTSYDMVYPTVDSVATKKVVLMRNDGKYYLLSSSSSLFDIDYTKNACLVDIKTNNGAKSIELKKQEEMSKFRTPLNKEETFPACFAFPIGVVPSTGQMQIRSKGKIYSFDLERE